MDFCLLARCGEEGRVGTRNLNRGEGVGVEGEVCDAPDGLVWREGVRAWAGGRGGTHGVRSMEIMLHDGVASHVVD